MTTTVDTTATQQRDNSMDPNEAYRRTQSRILSLQETILDSSKDMQLKEKPVKEEENKDETIKIDSSKILNYTKNKYKTVPKTIQWLTYNPFGCSIKDKFLNPKQEHCENKFELILEDFPPFLPDLNHNLINKIITVYIPNEIISQYLKDPLSNKRWVNNEIWGSDIYTDDSDIILVLKHMGVFQKVITIDCICEDAVMGQWNIENSDIIVKLLILDTLQSYQGSKRNGIRTRDWLGPQLHDGLSYGIYSIEFKTRDQSVTTSTWV
ncbi:transcriptional regulatory protein Rxt3p [Monosporozyma unispora]|nr:hypothetical protein C6P44_001747 [Kazachstania unispora]